MSYDADFIYRDLVIDVHFYGEERETRSGIVKSLFGRQYTLDLQKGFPALTTKKVNVDAAIHEMNWFLRGETNINTLKAPQLWKPWADEYGSLTGTYGENWRQWGLYAQQKLLPVFSSGYDQIESLLRDLKEDPKGRRHVVSAWNPMQADEYPQVPNACHTLFQCYVRGTFLDLQLYQRSVDIAIGLPFNMVGYAYLQTALAREVGLSPGRFIHSLGDYHIYKNHEEKLMNQISREPREAPNLNIHGFKSFWRLVEEDNPDNYKLENYNPHSFIKFPLAV